MNITVTNFIHLLFQ